MLTMTYTNTFKDKENNEQTTTNMVLVESERKGRSIIAQWNTNSKNHCKGMYNYVASNFSVATKEQMETMDLY